MYVENSLKKRCLGRLRIASSGPDAGYHTTFSIPQLQIPTCLLPFFVLQNKNKHQDGRRYELQYRFPGH